MAYPREKIVKEIKEALDGFDKGQSLSRNELISFVSELIRDRELPVDASFVYECVDVWMQDKSTERKANNDIKELTFEFLEAYLETSYTKETLYKMVVTHLVKKGYVIAKTEGIARPYFDEWYTIKNDFEALGEMYEKSEDTSSKEDVEALREIYKKPEDKNQNKKETVFIIIEKDPKGYDDDPPKRIEYTSSLDDAFKSIAHKSQIAWTQTIKDRFKIYKAEEVPFEIQKDINVSIDGEGFDKKKEAEARGLRAAIDIVGNQISEALLKVDKDTQSKWEEVEAELNRRLKKVEG